MSQGALYGTTSAASMQMPPQQQVVVQQSYDPLSISAEEATYTCTTCGFICGMTVAFGLISNEFPDDFSLRSERAVWVILILLTTCGSCWAVVVVEPVTGLFQDVRRQPRAQLLRSCPLPRAPPGIARHLPE